MALEGNYNFKSISLEDAYIKVCRVDYNGGEETKTQEKTPAVYNEDGTVKTEAVMEDVVVKNHFGSWVARIYKDKATRDADYNGHFQEIYGGFDVAVNSTAKNPVIQAYAAIKAMDAYKDYTDV